LQGNRQKKTVDPKQSGLTVFLFFEVEPRFRRQQSLGDRRSPSGRDVRDLVMAFLVAMVLLDLPPGSMPTGMPVDQDAAGESRNEKSGDYEKHHCTNHDKPPDG
jgi:hypothetical protein